MIARAGAYLRGNFTKLFAGRDYVTLNKLEVRADRVLANLDNLRKNQPGQAVIPVLKANAYGHGLIPVAKILNRADCAMLAVDGYFEAARIRRLTRHRLLVMGYIRPQNADLLDTKRCSFVVQDIASLEAFGRLRRPVRIHLELDTGMRRMGLAPDEVPAYLKTLASYPNLRLEGVMTHLADADSPDERFTADQVRLFDLTVDRILRAGFRPRLFHLAQTAGSAKVASRHANAVRLGIGVYGINPLQPNDKHFDALNSLRPVMRLTTTIVKTHQLRPGDKVSYNGIFTAPAAMRIGVLPLGYYEAVPRQLSNTGYVTSASGRGLPIVGRVCMNHTIIDITGTKLKIGDQVTVISDDPNQPNSIQRACREHGIFAYVWLANLTADLRRVVV